MVPTALLVAATLTFAPSPRMHAAFGRPQQQQQHAASLPCVMMAKGFGKVPEKAAATAPKAAKQGPKSEGQVRREKAAADLEKPYILFENRPFNLTYNEIKAYALRIDLGRGRTTPSTTTLGPSRSPFSSSSGKADLESMNKKVGR